MHTGRGYKKSPRDGPKHGHGIEISDVVDEQDQRSSLMDPIRQIGKLAKRRLALLKSVKVLEDQRAIAAAAMERTIDARSEEFDEMEREKEMRKHE